MQNPGAGHLMVFLPLIALLFASIHVGFEYSTGGVQSHHLLNRSDLPAVSNWLGLVILPLLGLTLVLRLRSHAVRSQWSDVRMSVLYGFFGALAYGATLAASFALGASNLAGFAFFGLIPASLLFSVYRIEFIVGFVTGMMFTFGSVLPLIIASVLATLSFSARRLTRGLLRLVRNARRA